jgi:hypothetical protein
MNGLLSHPILGWQPGIQEAAAVWDEEWDRFADDGMLD